MGWCTSSSDLWHRSRASAKPLGQTRLLSPSISPSHSDTVRKEYCCLPVTISGLSQFSYEDPASLCVTRIHSGFLGRGSRECWFFFFTFTVQTWHQIWQDEKEGQVSNAAIVHHAATQEQSFLPVSTREKPLHSIWNQIWNRMGLRIFIPNHSLSLSFFLKCIYIAVSRLHQRSSSFFCDQMEV